MSGGILKADGDDNQELYGHAIAGHELLVTNKVRTPPGHSSPPSMGCPRCRRSLSRGGEGYAAFELTLGARRSRLKMGRKWRVESTGRSSLEPFSLPRDSYPGDQVVAWNTRGSRGVTVISVLFEHALPVYVS